MVAIARIVAAQGLGGEVRLALLSDFPERFAAPLEVTLRTPAGERRARLTSFRPHRTGGVAAIAGITSRTAAEAVVGATVLVREEERWPVPEGRFYVDDLVGLKVFDDQGREVGTATDIVPNPAHDLLEVDHGRFFVPLHREWVEVDVAAGSVRLLRTLGGDDVAD